VEREFSQRKKTSKKEKTKTEERTSRPKWWWRREALAGRTSSLPSWTTRKKLNPQEYQGKKEV